MSTPWYLAGAPSRTAHGFHLTRRDLRMVMIGLSALGVLLFVAGLLLGIYAIGPLPARPSSESLPVVSKAPVMSPEPPAKLESEPLIVTSPEPEPAPEPALPEPSPLAAASPPTSPPKAPTAKAPIAKAPMAKAEVATIHEVQLGFFRVHENARQQQRALQERGWDAYILDGASIGREGTFSVRLGPFDTPTEARAEANLFEQREGMDTLIRFRDAPEEGQ